MIEYFRVLRYIEEMVQREMTIYFTATAELERKEALYHAGVLKKLSRIIESEIDAEEKDMAKGQTIELTESMVVKGGPVQ